MKRTEIVMLLLSGALVCGVSAARADDEMGGTSRTETVKKVEGRPGKVWTEVVRTKALVKDVDYDKRMLTLEMADGKTEEMAVDPAVRRFNEVKKGDELN